MWVLGWFSGSVGRVELCLFLGFVLVVLRGIMVYFLGVIFVMVLL